MPDPVVLSILEDPYIPAFVNILVALPVQSILIPTNNAIVALNVILMLINTDVSLVSK